MEWSGKLQSKGPVVWLNGRPGTVGLTPRKELALNALAPLGDKIFYFVSCDASANNKTLCTEVLYTFESDPRTTDSGNVALTCRVGDEQFALRATFSVKTADPGTLDEVRSVSLKTEPPAAGANAIPKFVPPDFRMYKGNRFGLPLDPKFHAMRYWLIDRPKPDP